VCDLQSQVEAAAVAYKIPRTCFEMTRDVVIILFFLLTLLHSFIPDWRNIEVDFLYSIQTAH
jgi:hypothetical protein